MPKIFWEEAARNILIMRRFLGRTSNATEKPSTVPVRFDINAIYGGYFKQIRHKRLSFSLVMNWQTSSHFKN